MVSIAWHLSVQLCLVSLNVTELYRSAVEHRGLRGISSIMDIGVHYQHIFTTNHLGGIFIFFAMTTDSSSPNASNTVGVINTEKDGAVAPRDMDTG